MEKTNMETLYMLIDRTVEAIQQQKDEPYLDSLAIVLESLINQDTTGISDEIRKQKILNAGQEIKLEHYTKAEIQKAIQFATLKGMKNATQQQHFMTPETVSLLIGYLAEKLFKDRETLRIFDPACGTGNLLIAVMKQLNKKMEVFGSEVDPTLIRLALINANLQEAAIEFFHQDSLRPFLLDPVDLVVADLPVGYYPDDIRAKDYALCADKGHSYAHHLFIEQSLNYMNEAGYAIFVIPDFLFDSDQSESLHTYLQQHAHIVGVLRLPESAFKSDKNGKSLLVLQKKGKHTATPKQPLLVHLPSFKNTKAMNDILDQMNSWFADYLK
ncbi:class I SAM-dependent methyltransferase [Lentibacillus sp. N15]|uniref:class I SAM-dependent methyltransferase n=1 Tax=Lentibacillus songyuanensis TaxID=3136161 RepID=UPI0031BB0143